MSETHYEVGEHILQFECKHAVFHKKGETSLCYTSSEEMGKFIAASLDWFKESGEMDKYIKTKNK